MTRALALALSLALAGGPAATALAQVESLPPAEGLPDAPAPTVDAAPTLDASMTLPPGQADLGLQAPLPAGAPLSQDAPDRLPSLDRTIHDADRDGRAGEALDRVFSGSARLPAAPEGGEGQGVEDPHEREHAHEAPALKPGQDPIDALLDKYKVPARDRALRKRLTQEAIHRVTLDIALFTGNPNVQVGHGSWWMTVQDLRDPSRRQIEIPVEDIFVRAVDEKGVEEAVGAALHETAHYKITRHDPNHPLTKKYHPATSPENDLLAQVIEDTRINTWALSQEPGTQPYFDAIYDSEWPENMADKEAMKRSRLEVLARSTFDVEHKDGKQETWMPPHVQYANAALYYWRHRKPAPFLEDKDAKAAFEKTKASLDRIRQIHPQLIGGVLTQPMKVKATMDAMEAMDRELYPSYEKLIKKSREQLKKMMQNGSKVKQNGGGQNQGPDRPQPSQNPASGASKPNTSLPDEKQAEKEADKILDDQAKDVAKRVHGGSHGDHGRKAGQDGGRGDDGQGMGGDESFQQRRENAVKQRQETEKSWTRYERYRLRAQELGLIDKVDGIIKQILMPTRHARLSRKHYDEGDEVDIDKYFDDRSQGRLDTPIMRVWNKRTRRSAKLSLVLDISGSMLDLTPEMTSPLDYAVLGIVAWVEVCQKNQLDFEVILFDTKQHVAHPFGRIVNKDSKDKIIEAILKNKGGSTDIGAAYKFSLDSLAKQQATHRFIIVATDEQHNSGTGPEAYKEEAKRLGIVTIALVIGGDAEKYKEHFDFAVRVKEPRDFPSGLLEVLKRAIRWILGPSGLGFGEAAPAPAPAPQDPWRAAADRLGAELEVPGPTDPEALKAAALESLRQRPGQPFDDTMLEAFAKVRSVPSSRLDVYREGNSGAPRPDSPPGRVNAVRAIDGKVYAAGERGLFVRERDGWKQLDASGELLDVQKIGGAWYLAHEKGVDLWEDGVRKRSLSAGPVSGLSEWAGRPVVQIGVDAHYIREGGRWTRKNYAWGWATRELQAGGRRYAATHRAVYEKTWWGWKTILSNRHVLVDDIHDVAVFDGKLYAATDFGLLRRDGKRWKTLVVSPDARSIFSIGGRLYAAGGHGVREVVGEEDVRVLPHHVLEAVAAGRDVFLRQEFGEPLLRWRPKTILFSPKEETELLNALPELPGPEAPRESAPLESDPSGLLKKGRRIFNGFHGDGLGFGDNEPSAAPGSVWSAAASRLAARLGTPPSAVGPEALRGRTVELLRSRPDLPLDEALLEACASLSGAPVERREAARARLRGLPELLPGSPAAVNELRWIDGKAYAASEHGLFQFDGRAWTLLLDKPGVLDVAKLAGRWYAANWENGRAHGWASWSPSTAGRNWSPSFLAERLEAAREWLQPSVRIGGTLYTLDGDAAIRRWGASGLGRKWELPGAPWVTHFVEHRGELVAAAANGVWRLPQGGEPVRLDEHPANALASIGGELYASDDDGFYQLTPEGRRPMLTGSQLYIDRIVRAGDAWLLPTAEGVYQWRPPEPILFPTEAADAAAEISRAARAPAPAAGKDEGLLKKGRRLFSDFFGGGMGFGEQAPAPVWRAAAEKTAAWFGVPSSASDAAALEAEVWKRLRSRPDLALEDALLDAFASLRALPPARTDELKAERTGELRPFAAPRGVENLRQLHGDLYAASDDGLFVREGGGWRRLYDLPHIQDVVESGGRWYVASKHGVDAAEGVGAPTPETKWRPTLMQHGEVRRLFDWDGRPLALSSDGPYLRVGGLLWSRFYGSMDAPARIVEARGESWAVSKSLYRKGFLGLWRKVRLPGERWARDLAAGDDAVYVAGERGVWRVPLSGKPALLSDKRVNTVAVIDGRLYVGDQDGFYRWDGGRWATLIDQQYLHLDQIEPSYDGWMLRGQKGLYLFRPARELLSSAEAEELTAELARRPSHPLPAAEAGSDAPLLSKRGRSLFDR